MQTCGSFLFLLLVFSLAERKNQQQAKAEHGLKLFPMLDRLTDNMSYRKAEETSTIAMTYGMKSAATYIRG